MLTAVKSHQGADRDSRVSPIAQDLLNVELLLAVVHGRGELAQPREREERGAGVGVRV